MGEENDLNNEFECLLQELECAFPKLSFREKSIATEWIKKLKRSNSNIEEMKLRVDFIEFFVNCLQCGVFSTEPFSKMPPLNESLHSLRNLLPADRKVRSSESPDAQGKMFVTEMFDLLPDRGAFLAEQPVPREGTFFVVNLKPNELNSPHHKSYQGGQGNC